MVNKIHVTVFILISVMMIALILGFFGISTDGDTYRRLSMGMFIIVGVLAIILFVIVVIYPMGYDDGIDSTLERLKCDIKLDKVKKRCNHVFIDYDDDIPIQDHVPIKICNLDTKAIRKECNSK